MTAETTQAALFNGVEAYRYLERRPRSWRRQLYLKSRNIAVGQLIYSMRANKQMPEEAAEDYGLPVEQVQEAILYYERHRDLIEQDAEEERRSLESQGIPLEPRPVPR
ncbi:MAG: hypothetical protein HY332_09100 [Chloroflexi bacterium]|nr:hypothetical protein [Chloroflexota bacterium]